MEIRQVERVVAVVECCVVGKLEEVLDMVVLPEWRRSGPHWNPNTGGCCAKSGRACGHCNVVSGSELGCDGVWA